MKGVVAAPQVEAVEAGRRALLEGGNAVDAAIATAFAQGVVDPQMTSIGGWGILQLYDARSGQHLCIDFYGRAPLKATPDMWAKKVKRRLLFDLWELEGHVNEVGHLAVTCPGTLLGFWEAHRRFGTLPWKEVLEPAIELADKGFAIPGELEALWSRAVLREGGSTMWEILTATPGAAKLFTKEGRIYRAGEWFTNKDYANTLRHVAKEGPDILYKGWMGKLIAEDFAKNGGLLTEEDLRQYKVQVHKPLRSTYRGVEVAGNPPPCSCLQVMEILNILEGFDLTKMGFGTAEYFHIMALAQKASFSDRAAYLGDPAFHPVPTEKLISKEHAREWQGKIMRNEPIKVPEVGVAEPAHTTTVSAFDEEGTAIAITHTLSTPASGVVVGDLGFMFNNFMMGFDPYPGHPNSIAPGKARTTGMAPTLLFSGGKPWAAISAPGATKILTGVLQTIVNMVDFKMSPVEAVSALRIHCETPWIDAEARVYYTLKEELEKRGHTLAKSIFSHDPFFGLVHVAARDPQTGQLSGAADPRGRGGLAIVR